MDGVRFALPSLGSAAMSTVDQTTLLTNQATAVIVSAWLSHRSVGLQTGKAFSAGDPSDDQDRFDQTITEGELSSVVNAVQTALRGA